MASINCRAGLSNLKPNVGHRRAERGATVVEYGLITALFVLVTVSGIQLLFDSSSRTLQANGTDVAEPRQYADALVTSTLPAPDDWLGNTIPQGETLYDITLSFADNCALQDRRTLDLEPCNGQLDNLYSLEFVAANDYQITGSNSGRCVVSVGRGADQYITVDRPPGP